MRSAEQPDSLGIRFAQLAAVWAYAVAQPVFSLLEANPEFLVVRGATRTEIILFAIAVSVAVPLVALACEFITSKVSTELTHGVHLVFLGLFLVPLGLRAARLAGLSATDTSLMCAWLLVVLALTAYVRWRLVRRFVLWSVLLPVAGTLLFVGRIPLATDDARAAPVTIPSHVPVVMLVLDEFPASSIMTTRGAIDAERYPNFARLARSATWYRNATTVSDMTASAVPAILTGRVPSKNQLPRLADHPGNLFTLLGQSYDLHVHEEITQLCPTKMCPNAAGSVAARLDGLLADVGIAYMYRVVPEAWVSRLPSIDGRWGQFVQRGRMVTARTSADFNRVFTNGWIWPSDGEFDSFLTTLPKSAVPRTLYYGHFLFPHFPWKFLPSGRHYGFGADIDGFDGIRDRWGTDPWLVEQGLQRHLLQVQYADAQLGRLLQRLDESGLSEHALLVVVADHGASFEPGGRRRHVDSENLADIASVPLFVKYPNQQVGRVDDRPARTVDVLPTIADVVGVQLPWHVDGQSLLARPADRSVVRVTARRNDVVFRARAADVVRRRQATVARNAELVGEGARSLYRIGSHLSLLGQRVGRFEQSIGESRAHLEDSDAFLDVEIASSFVPTRVAGSLDSSIGSDAELAIAVNGTIRALTRVFRSGDAQLFRAMVPEAALRPGLNEVGVYAIDDSGHGIRLVKLRGS